MTTIIEALRTVVGEASFFVNGQWQFDKMIEYGFACIIVLAVIGQIFRLVRTLFGGK